MTDTYSDFNDPDNMRSLFDTAPEQDSEEEKKASMLFTQQDDPLLEEYKHAVNKALREITKAVIAHVKEHEPFEKVEKITMVRLKNIYSLGVNHTQKRQSYICLDE